MSRAKNLTLCTVCTREVGVSQNWARWQSGQSPEWRVARHVFAPPSTHRKRAPICAGSGILVDPTVVFPANWTTNRLIAEGIKP